MIPTSKSLVHMPYQKSGFFEGYPDIFTGGELGR